MKTLRTLVVALFAMIIGLSTAFGQVAPLPVGDSTAAVVPSTGGSLSTATNGPTLVVVKKDTNRPRPASVQPGTGRIVVIPVLTYPQNDPRSQDSIAHLLTGTTNLWSGVSSNGHYAIIRDGKIGWRNLIYSQTTSTDWFVAQEVVLAQSLNNKDDISLADIRISAMSTSGALDEPEYRVEDGEGYGPLAFGIKADGSVIDSGPADQKCWTVVIVFQTSLFNGGATPDGVNDAHSYLDRQVGFAITYRAWLDGDPASEGRAVVSLDGYSNQPASLVINKADGNVRLASGNTNRLYQILTATDVNGPWQPVGSLYVGEDFFVNPGDDEMRIFRAQSFP